MGFVIFIKNEMNVFNKLKVLIISFIFSLKIKNFLEVKWDFEFFLVFNLYICICCFIYVYLLFVDIFYMIVFIIDLNKYFCFC